MYDKANLLLMSKCFRSSSKSSLGARTVCSGKQLKLPFSIDIARLQNKSAFGMKVCEEWLTFFKVGSSLVLATVQQKVRRHRAQWTFCSLEEFVQGFIVTT